MSTSVADGIERPGEARGAGFWVQVTALLVDFLVPTVLPTLVSFIRPDWGGWVPATLVLTFVYLTALTAASPHATIGMRLFGLSVKRVDGGSLGPLLAAWRSFLVMWSVALIGLGVIAIAFDDHHQGWHDRLTSTIVAGT
jgi:uncharacterized RDD family membrane protein YckC